MNRVDSWVKMCLRKKAFKTKEFANKVAAKFNQRVYYCPHCCNFHLTKK